MAGLGAAARLAERQYPARIAAEAFDVLAHPAQRGDDVHHPNRAGMRERRPLVGQVQVAERAQPVVDRHHHAVAEPRQLLAVVARRVARAAVEAAAVDVDQHRPLRRTVDGRGPDVQHQAVLAHAARLDVEHDQAAVGDGSAVRHLRRDLAVLIGVANAAPLRRRRRGHEAIGPGRVAAIAHALEHPDAAGRQATKPPLRRFDDWKDVALGDGPRGGWPQKPGRPKRSGANDDRSAVNHRRFPKFNAPLRVSQSQHIARTQSDQATPSRNHPASGALFRGKPRPSRRGPATYRRWRNLETI